MTDPTPNSATIEAARVLAAKAEQRLLFLWRHLAHVLVGTVVAWEVGKIGLGVSDATQNLAETVLFGAGTAAYGVAQHWLETRTGDSRWARAARTTARWLVLGAPAVPTYAVPSA